VTKINNTLEAYGQYITSLRLSLFHIECCISFGKLVCKGFLLANTLLFCSNLSLIASAFLWPSFSKIFVLFSGRKDIIVCTRNQLTLIIRVRYAAVTRILDEY